MNTESLLTKKDLTCGHEEIYYLDYNGFGVGKISVCGECCDGITIHANVQLKEKSYE
jgi:hypothetical protein